MPFIKLQLRRGTAAEWIVKNPILLEGEMGLETDTSQFKIGNGIAVWTALPYGGITGGDGATGPTGPAGGPKGDTGATGPAPAPVPYIFDGGQPTSNYSLGPAFDCGGVL